MPQLIKLFPIVIDKDLSDLLIKKVGIVMLRLRHIFKAGNGRVKIQKMVVILMSQI